MMYLTRMTLLVMPITAVVLMGLTACGTNEEREYAYRKAESIKPIEMPPGLAMNPSQESLEIPEQTSDNLGKIEELERPPKIIDSVDLKILDEDTPKSKTSEKPPEKKQAADSGTSNALTINATRNADGNSVLMVDGGYDQVFPLVKPALIELGFKIDDSSKGGQLYAISKELPTLNLSDKPVNPGDVEPEVKEEFQIHVKPSGEQTQITVHNKFGEIEGSGLAEHLLLQIKEIMENPKGAPKSNS